MKPINRIFAIALIGIGSQFFAACGEKENDVVTDNKDTAPPSGPVLSWPATRATDGGSFEVTLKPGSKIIGHQHFTLDIDLKAKQGNLENIVVKADGDMPEHKHGMNTKPEVTEMSSSKFHVEGMLFHMSGDWEIYVDIERDGKKERAIFPISVE